METTIIINEQHKLLPEQQDILTETFGTYSTLLVPTTAGTNNIVTVYVKS